MLLGVSRAATELSAYGPWLLGRYYAPRQTFYFINALAITCLCLALDWWALPGTSTERQIRRQFTRGRDSVRTDTRSPLFGPLHSPAGTPGTSPTSHFLESPDLGRLNASLNRAFAEYNSSSSLTAQASSPLNAVPVPYPDVRHNFVTAGLGTVKPRSSPLLSPLRVPNRDFPFTADAKKPKSATHSVVHSHRTSAAEDSGSFKDSLAHQQVNQRYPKSIFLMLFGFCTLAVLRRKWIIIALVDILSDFQRTGASAPIVAGVNKTRETLISLLGLSGLGFFYWSVIYWRCGLVMYTLLSNFFAFLTLISIHFLWATIQGYTTLIFLLHQSSVAGIPIAVYGSLLDWSPDYVHYAGVLSVATGVLSLVLDFAWPYYSVHVLDSLLTANKQLITLSAIAFACPAILLFLVPQDSEQRRTNRKSPAYSLTPKRISTESEITQDKSDLQQSTCYALPYVSPRFVPLFHYFNVGQVLELQRRRERLFHTAAQ